MLVELARAFDTCVTHIDSLVQDRSNFSALAMELLQSCTKPSICISSRSSDATRAHQISRISRELSLLDTKLIRHD